MRALRVLLALVLGATAAATAAASPGAPATLAIDHVRVTGGGRHEVLVRVQDDTGAPVPGLERGLTFAIDGRGAGETRVEFGGAGPRTLFAVIDAPLLRGDGAALADDVLRAAARDLAAEDRVLVVLAGDKPVAKEFSARELTQTGSRLATMAAAGGPRLLDALADAAKRAAERRRGASGAVLVVTLGEDRGSRASTSDVLAAARRGGITSLAVVLVPGGDAGAAPQLERLVALTGGTLWHVTPGAPVPPSLGPGVRALLDRYRATFTDGQWRKDGERRTLQARLASGLTADRAYDPADVYEPAWWTTAALWVVIGAVLIVAAVLVLGRRRTRQVCLLVVQGGEEDGQWYEVLDLPLRIGSARENDIVIVKDGVSRNHCLLEREGKTLVLVDTNSEFGTFVNGLRVTRHPLAEDDVIRLGQAIELAYEGR